LECITVNDVVSAVDGRLICGNGSEIITSVTTDSRCVDADLFIALKGERFDANDFAMQYLNSGKSVLVSRNFEPVADKNIIHVDDTNAALLKLAAFYRKMFKIPVIGITGSVGKTSTKEMISSVLSVKNDIMKTDGNFNNEIGVPLTLFKLEKTHQCAVVEMGMSNFGEMSRLTSAVCPDIAVITNIGTAHIGNLGSQENILKAKLEITEGMNEKSLLVLNGDDKLLWSLKGKLPFNILYYGIENKAADIVATDIVTDADKSAFTAMNKRFVINTPGEHNVYNAMAAYLVGKQLDMNDDDIAKGVSQFRNCGMRQNVIKLDGLTLIEDCYNASYDSVKASLKVLKSVAKGRTVAVLGDILEQGEYAKKIHSDIGTLVAEGKIDVLVTVGESSKIIAEVANMGMCFDTAEDAANAVSGIIAEGDTVLFKGSRGMHLEIVCDKVKTNWKEKSI